MAFFLNGIELPDEKIDEVMDELQDIYELAQQQTAKELELNEDDAGLILYLRSRSRWTQEKENYLIQLSKEGKKLPNVLSGEF